MNSELILENVDLTNYNSLRVAVTARFFVEVKSVEEVLDVLKFAKTKNLEILVIGLGSNLVLSRNWDGIVICIKIEGLEVIEETNEKVKISVGAGYNWHSLVEDTVERGWFGLENLALIPGTVGAAPVQNIGAYGVEVADFIESVEVIDLQSLVLHRFSKEECQFQYRHSIFYGRCPNEWIITSVVFNLSKVAKVKVVYPSLVNQLKEDGFQIDSVTPHDVLNTVVKVRQSKLPDPNLVANVGSFFKNPIVSAEKYENLKTEFDDLVAFKFGADYKLAAGWLIDKAGFKGFSENNLCMYEKNALVLVNFGGANGQEVLEFAEKIQSKVKDIFGVDLEIEPLVV